MAGLVKLQSNIFPIGAGLLSGGMVTRASGCAATLAAGLLTTVGWRLAMMFHGSIALLMVVLCVMSFGTTMLYAKIPNVIVDPVPPERMSEATGILFVICTPFMGIGSQIIAVLLAQEIVHDPAGGTGAFQSALAFQLTLGIIAALSVAAALGAFLMPYVRDRSTTREQAVTEIS